MAKAKAHKLGQMIGEFIEKYFEDELLSICKERGLYLDAVGKERKARTGKKVRWHDAFGSSHDLDFVIERNGSNENLGIPIALIECAWRRYTKHSKNKAQEIQGALLPIAEKYKLYKPFLGAVIAGVFTKPSIEQLELSGFHVLYLEYEDIIDAFNMVNIDVSFEENTTDELAEEKIKMLQKLTDNQYKYVFSQIIYLNYDKVRSFKNSLMASLDRQISYVIISPLYGVRNEFRTINDAILYLKSNFCSQMVPSNIVFQKLYILIEYSNADKITGEFTNITNAIKFLEFHTNI